MARYIEFHGRLTRVEGAGLSPGAQDLHVSLHPGEDGDSPVWSETIPRVAIAKDGSFQVVLGRTNAVHADLFRAGPVWLAIRTVRGGAPGAEAAPRTPISGALVLLSAAVDELQARVDQLQAESGADPLTARRLRVLHRRLKALEHGQGPLASLAGGVDDVRSRIARIDDDGGRLDLIEDELEDLVGPDGDLIDLLERVERLEGSGPVPKRIPPPPSGPIARMDPRFIAALAERVEALTLQVAGFDDKLASQSEITADSLHAVRRGGDVMTGGLTINRGGLEVLSGGIKCRGADVNSLEASVHVKAPKVIADAVELRGDLTVDNTRRVLQIRNVEGRAGSGRKDGALHLNTRSGDEVVVGNAEAAAGLTVHGAVVSDAVRPRVGGLATTLPAGEAVEPGDACAVDASGAVVRAHAESAAALVGVCVEAAGVLDGADGEGRARVAYGGVVKCRVAGPVTPGDLLVASTTPGRACRAEGEVGRGALLGRALGGSRGATGEILALVLLG